MRWIEYVTNGSAKLCALDSKYVTDRTANLYAMDQTCN